jgi:hypothetical protein
VHLNYNYSKTEEVTVMPNMQISSGLSSKCDEWLEVCFNDLISNDMAIEKKRDPHDMDHVSAECVHLSHVHDFKFWPQYLCRY